MFALIFDTVTTIAFTAGSIFFALIPVAIDAGKKRFADISDIYLIHRAKMLAKFGVIDLISVGSVSLCVSLLADYFSIASLLVVILSVVLVLLLVAGVAAMSIVAYTLIGLI